MRIPTLRRRDESSGVLSPAAFVATLAPAVALAVPAFGDSAPELPPVEASAAADDVLALKGARVIVRPGEVLEGATVLVKNGVIVAVGADVAVPDGARTVEGAVVCAGFIDPWSSLGIDGATFSDGRTNAATRATDGLDPWSSDYARSEAAASGVLMVRVQSGDGSEFGGIGAVVRNGLAGDHLVLESEALVAAAVGLSDGRRAKDPFDRVGEADRLASKLEDGFDYRADWLQYADELEAWEAEIAKEEAKLEKDFKKAKKKRDKDVEEAEEEGEEFEDKKYKEDKRPRMPRYDASKEVLARIVDGELPLVVRCEGAAELRALLAATKPFPRLRMTIAGGSGAPLLARELVDRGIPVIVQPIPYADGSSARPEGHDLGLAGRLEELGVKVLLGTGGAQARDLPLLAGLAVGHGLDAKAAFEALTVGAARALDIADRVGTVEVGKHAELLVLDGDPLTSQARVRAAISAGRVVHEAPTR